MAFEGKHKLANKWEEDVYVVDAQPNPDVPVYSLFRETDHTKKNRTLHWNHLLPVGMVPAVAIREGERSTLNPDKKKRTQRATLPRTRPPLNRNATLIIIIIIIISSSSTIEV